MSHALDQTPNFLANHSKNNTHVIYVDAETIAISKWE